jgi:hypothetical protein
MKTSLIEEAKNVFQSVERWTAFYEIEKQISPIMDHWLITGAKALRRDFANHPSLSWKCSEWGWPRDTRWYLDDLGELSIGIGIGWQEFELHLFHGGCDQQIREQALRVLESQTFEPLRALTGSPEARALYKKEGCILSVRDFNPFDEVGDSILRQRIIAWHAVHKTSEFVEKVSGKIRQITEDHEIVRLIRDLNQQCKKGTT